MIDEDFEFIDPSTPLIIHSPKKEYEEEKDEDDDFEVFEFIDPSTPIIINPPKKDKDNEKKKPRVKHYEPADPNIKLEELQKMNTINGDEFEPPIYINGIGECFQMYKGRLNHILPTKDRIQRYDHKKQKPVIIPKKEIMKYITINTNRLPDYTLINDLIYDKNNNIFYEKIHNQENLYKQYEKEIDTKLIIQINSMKEIIPCECPPIAIQIPIIKDIKKKLHEITYLYYNQLTNKYFNIITGKDYEVNKNKLYQIFPDKKRVYVSSKLMNKALTHKLNGTTFEDESEEEETHEESERSERSDSDPEHSHNSLTLGGSFHSHKEEETIPENKLLLHQVGKCIHDFIYNMDTDELLDRKNHRVLTKDKSKHYRSGKSKFSQKQLDQAIVNEEKYHLYKKTPQ
jgi:hypothetical protein